MSSATSVPSTHKTSSPQLPQSSHTYDQQSTNHQSSSPQLDITKDEFDRLSEALKKEEFRKLFLDYVEEIQNPENRKRYEEEIKQIEAERGVDVVFIHPEPGFVIKTSQDGDQKCFINCAKNAHVAKPSNEICQNNATGQRGISWSIPMAQAPPRDDLDNNNKRCRVYDVVFNPDALYLAEKNSAFHKCLVDTALDAVEREYKVKLDRINIKFPKMQFKGMARPTVIRKLAKNQTTETQEPHPLESIYPAKPTTDASQPKVLPTKTMNLNSTTTSPIQNSEYCTPKYRIKHCRDVDLTEFTNELDAKLNVTVPRELAVIIDLPLLNSSSECQLDVTPKTIFLLSDREGAKYRLNVDLPFKVCDREGSAKFDTDTRRLTITLPVIQQSIGKQREMHESLLHFSREDSGVESDMREDCHSNDSTSPIEELSSTSIRETLQEAANQEAQSETNPQTFLKHDIDYQFPPKFDSNVLDNTLSVVLHVRNVQEDSIQIRRHDRSLHVQFTSIGSGFYPTHYAFYLQLTRDVPEATLKDVEVEAWENNVILNVNLNQSAEHISSYLAGLDSDQLKECWIHEKSKIVHKSRQRQKPSNNESPSLDITIQRSDYNKSVEIEIKPRVAGNSACYANTTEDEDHQQLDDGSDNAMHQNLKKLNKKQKRKNKKRRSLSESACDEIKAYQQQQQQTPSLASTVPEVPEHDEDADDDDDEDSSPDRTEKSAKSSSHLMSSFVNVPIYSGCGNNNVSQQRKQRSFSESRDSVISLSAGSASYKGILKHYSRYAPSRPSISDSCSSIDECSSAYSTSVDGLMTTTFNSLRFSHSFSDIPEENVAGLSESCKKTVRFSEVIKKQVFRLDSSILGQRKKNQKRRDRKQRALQRRLSEGDSADYEDNKPMTPLPSTPPSAQYLKIKNNNQTINNNSKNTNKCKGNEKKSNTNMKTRARLESESSSDVDINKNAMMFEMDM